MFSTKLGDSELKMIDFGLLEHFGFIGEVQHQSFGILYTVSPEVNRGSYEKRYDVWTIGVFIYFLLSSDSPFGGCSGPESLIK